MSSDNESFHKNKSFHKNESSHEKESSHKEESSHGNGLKFFRSDSLKKNAESDTLIELSSKPISFTRKTTIRMTPFGIPIIRDVIIIETEASTSRILFFIILIAIYCTVMHCLIMVCMKVSPNITSKIIRMIVWGVPPLAAIFFGYWLFLGMWIVVNLFLFVYLYSIRNNRNSTAESLQYSRNEEENIPGRSRTGSTMRSEITTGILSRFRFLSRMSFMKCNPSIENLYRFYSSLFYYAHLVVSSCVILLIFALLNDNFLLLNFGLVIFIYTNYFLILVQDIVIMGGGEMGKFGVLDERDCGICNKRVENSKKTKDIFDREGDLDNNFSEKDNLNQNNMQEKNKSLDKVNLLISLKNYLISNTKTQKTHYTLPCSHKYHANCIRGWYLLTHSEKCPCCQEKYNPENILNTVLKGLFFYSVFMDMVRKSIVFGVFGALLVLWVKRGSKKEASLGDST